MAFSGNYMTDSFKSQLLEGVHDFRSGVGDVFKLALYTDAASLTAGTTAYTSADEIAASGSYTAGGVILTSSGITLSNGVAFVTFSNPTITSATITARGGLIYNSTPGHTYTNPSCVVLDFGSNKSVVSGPFTIQFPPADPSNAIIRIG